MTTDRSFLARFAWLSIGAALLTIVLKTIAYVVTDSVGLLSDALESSVNLAGAVMALAMLNVAARPADDTHAYGHSKAEYFASGVEGSLIVIAAGTIALAAVPRFFAPYPLERVGTGLVLSILAAIVNLATALVIRRAGKRHQSITLEANAKHLLADVWTSAAVVAGIVATIATGWQRFDPIIAMLVACHIVWTGVRILRTTVGGLMDKSLPREEQDTLRRVLDRYQERGAHYHALRTRQAGARGFVSVHVLVPGEWSVQRGHELCEEIEGDIRATLPHVAVLTHLESLDDPASWKDMTLERTDVF